MSTKFLIATDSTVPKDVKNVLTGYLQGKGWTVWHWIDDLWLVVDVPPDVSVESLSREIRTLMPPDSIHIVLKMDGPVPYFGRGGKDAWEWMYRHWGPVDG